MDINTLLTLSKIFKEGYTIQIKNSDIQQYSNINKPYIVSYRTLITIKNDIPIFNKHCKIPKQCIIGYWYNKKINTGCIELNKAFKDKNQALLFAIKHKQQYVYDMNTQRLVV